MIVYDVIGAQCLDKTELKIKRCTKNTLNLVCKIHKILQILQKACVNRITYVRRLFCTKLTLLECLIIQHYCYLAFF